VAADVRLVFFGTPDFAVPSLRALVGEGFDLAAVVTQPDRPRGRTRSTLFPPPVKEVAQAEGIPVLQPANPNAPTFLAELREYEPSVGIVAAYGHILRSELLALPERGMVNVHASLLPALRGAAPIPHTILGGLDETGVTIMQMDAGVDTGPILHQVPTPVATDETAGELEARLAELGALALIEALALLEAGALTPRPQDDHLATTAPKLAPERSRIDWTERTVQVARLIRALDPRPGAWTELAGRRIKVFGPRQAGAAPPDTPPGTIIETDPALLVVTGDSLVQLLDVLPEGKSRLAASDWIRGRGAHPGDRFV
jgi:methionyl-tRNA formyltransferase